MATVSIITLLFIVKFHEYKMDDGREEKRSGRLSQREKRWSMNSQRLEEIVAELMKPISDLRHSFDTDLSALLEEYLTEAGLHALDAEGGEEHGATPNFAELALLLQQSASIYGRKVDFLYQHVLSVSDSLQNTTTEISGSNSEGDETRTTSKRKRKHSVCGEFCGIEVEPCGSARREAGPPPRPPPTLPRMYVELEPRVLTDCDAPLRDYAGEPIGLLSDFHVTWRLQEGFLVEELEGSGVGEGPALRPVPLLELQAALEAAAPPSPPPAPHEDSPPPDYAPPCSTPLPADISNKMIPPPNKIERKRKNDINIDLVFDGNIKILLSKGVLRRLRRAQEFSVSSEWVSCVAAERATRLLRMRRDQPADRLPDFRGFDLADDAGGFCGWSSSELEMSRSRTELTLREGSRLGSQLDSRLGTHLGWEGGAGTVTADSDDDGFFEQSSLGESDGSRADDGGNLAQPNGCELSAELCVWRAGVVSRAAAAAARPPLEVRALAATVLATLRPAPALTPARQLLAAATQPEDVSRLFLATLFLANAGNVEISCGEPLTVDSFSVRVVGDGGGAGVLRPATPDHEQFLR